MKTLFISKHPTTSTSTSKRKKKSGKSPVMASPTVLYRTDVQATLPSSFQISTALVTSNNNVLIASTNGTVTTLSPELSVLNSSMHLISSSVKALLQLTSSFIVCLSHDGTVSVFDLVTLGLVESLPFRNVISLDVFKKKPSQNQEEKSVLVIVTSNNQIVIYEFDDVSSTLEMTHQLKLNEKINYVKLLDETHLIYSTHSNAFYSLKINANQTTSGTHTRLCDLGRSGFFGKQCLRVLQNSNTADSSGNHLLVSKGNSAMMFDQDLHITKPIFQWEFYPRDLIYLSPFLLLITNHHIHIKDFNTLETYQTLEVLPGKILSASINSVGELIIILQNSEVRKYALSSFESILDQLEIRRSIGLLKQLHHDQISHKYLRLRELEILHGLDLFRSGNIKPAIDTFSDFLCPPSIVIGLYPDWLTGLKSETIVIPKNRDIDQENQESMEAQVDEKAIYLLTYYIADIRRKLERVLRNPEHQIQLEYDGTLTLDLFTNDDIHYFTSPKETTPTENLPDSHYHDTELTPHTQHTVSEIQTLLDTTLFQCYAEINPGLIGSLVRVDNHCDVQLVERKLKSKGLINELIDFYFKRTKHEEALRLLWKLILEKNHDDGDPDATTDSAELKGKADPLLLVRYLQKLNNDNIDLILKYGDLLIDIDRNFGIEIFIDSPNSDTYDRLKVWKFLKQKSDLYIERKYIEYIIVDLNEDAVFYHTRLVEIYLLNLADDGFEVDSINYKKLYGILQTGNYDLSSILQNFDTLPTNNHILLLKTFILSRLNRHEDVLKIYVNEIQDSLLAVHYLSSVFEHDDTNDGVDYYLKLINIFWDHGEDKDSILKLLVQSKLTSRIPIMNIIKALPSSGKDREKRFTVQELEQFLTKSLRVQKQSQNLARLKRTLLTLSNIKDEETLLNLSTFKFDILRDEERCFMCDGALGNSVINCIPLHHGENSLKLEKLLTSGGKVFKGQGVNHHKEYVLVHFGCTRKFEKLKQLEEEKVKMKTVKLGEYVSMQRQQS